MTRDELFFKPKSVYETADEAKVKEIYDFAEGYKTWLDASRTERLAVREAVKRAEKAGFRPWVPGKSHKAGEKLYFVNLKKALTLAMQRKKSLGEGPFTKMGKWPSSRRITMAESRNISGW